MNDLSKIIRRLIFINKHIRKHKKIKDESALLLFKLVEFAKCKPYKETFIKID